MNALLLILLLLISCAVQAQQTDTKAPQPVNKVEYSFSEGSVNGKPLRMESSRTGGTTLSTGSLGTKPVNTLTVRLDMIEITTGTVGNESVEVITVTPKKD